MVNIARTTNLCRDQQHEVFVQPVAQFSPDSEDIVIARILRKPSGFWIFHKELVDESLEQCLECKSEEKLWLVV